MTQPQPLQPSTAATTSPMPAFESAAGRLIARLVSYVPREGHRGDRGQLAILRRAAGRKTADALEATAMAFRSASAELCDREIEALFTAATLFALHPSHGRPGAGDGTRSRSERSLGASLRAVRYREGTNEDDPGVERRFIALLSCSREALPEHLRHLIKLLHSRNEHAPVDYIQLARDIRDWDRVDRTAQKAWARGFWSYQASDDEETQTAAGNSPRDD